MTSHQMIKRVAWDIFIDRQKREISGTSEGDWEAAREKLGIPWAKVRFEAWQGYLRRQYRGLPGTPEDDWYEVEWRMWQREFWSNRGAFGRIMIAA